MVNNQNQQLESNITGEQLATEQNQGAGVTDGAVADVVTTPTTEASLTEPLAPITPPAVEEAAPALPAEQAAQFAEVTGVPEEVSPLSLLGTPTVSDEAKLARETRDVETVSSMVSQAFFGELQDLSRSGTRLTEAERLRIFGDVFSRFQGQIPPEQRVEALRQAEAKFLDDAKARGFSDFEAVAKQFNARLDRNTTLINSPNSQLANDLATGNITQGDLDDMRNLDINKYNSVIEEFNEIKSSNAANQSINPSGDVEVVESAPLPIDQYFAKNGIDPDNVAKFMGGEGNALALYDSLVNNEEARALDKEIIRFKDQRFEKEQSLERVKDEIIRDFGGKLSSGALASLTSDRTKKIRDEVETLNSQIDNRTDALNNAKVSGQAEYTVLLDQRKFQYDESWKQAEFDYKVDKDEEERKWRDKKLSLTESQRITADNIDLISTFQLNDLNGAQVASAVGHWQKLGVDNFIMTMNPDGSATYINRKNSADVRVFIPENVSPVPLGNNKQISSNNRASVASSVGQFTAMSKAPGGRASTIGDGVLTSIGGPKAFSGLDIDGNIGDPITAPIAGTITAFVTDKTGNKALEMTSVDGIKFRFNHLNDIPADIKLSLQQGIPVPVGAGEIIAELGNTGFVLKMNGQKPSAQELAAGFGSHLDLTGKQNGNYMSMPDLIEYVTTGTLPGQEINTGFQSVSQLDKASLDVGFGEINDARGGTDTSMEGRKALFNQILALDDPERLKGFLVNQTMETFPNTEQTSIRKKINVVNQLETLEGMIDQFTDLGGDLGIFKGKRDELSERLGGLETPTAKLAIAMGILMDDVVRERTGAAFTKDEEIFYGKLFPSRTKSAALNKQIITQLKGSLSLSSKGVIETQLKSHLGENLYKEIYGDASVFDVSVGDLTNQIDYKTDVMANAVDVTKSAMAYQLEKLQSKFQKYSGINSTLPTQ